MELMKLRQAGFSWQELSIMYGVPIRTLKMYLESFIAEERGYE